MARRPGVDDPFRSPFSSAPLGTTNLRNNSTSQNHHPLSEIQRQISQNPTSPNRLCSPTSLTTTNPKQFQDDLSQLHNQALQRHGGGLVGSNPATTQQTHLVDGRYNQVNPPRGSSLGSTTTMYRMYPDANADSIPGFGDGSVLDVSNLETDFSLFNMSTTTPSLPSTADFLANNSVADSSSSWFQHCVPTNAFNDFYPPFMYYPYGVEKQVVDNNNLQSRLDRVRAQAGLLPRNQVAVAPFLLNESFEDVRDLRLSLLVNNQYGNVQNCGGSPRNPYGEFNRPAPAATTPRLSTLNTINGGVGCGFLAQACQSRLPSDNSNRGSRALLDFGAQTSGGTKSLHSSSSSSNLLLSPFYGSPVLIKPRPPQYPTYSLQELRGRVCALARDPLARLFLEQKVVERDEAFVQLIFTEVKTELLDLIVDHSANHLMQKLVGVFNEDQMTQFILSITASERRLLGICDDSSGTYVMQRLLEGPLIPRQKSLLVSAFKNIAATLSKTQHGHHVIMHCLRRFPNQFTMELVDEIVNNCVDLATNKSGCCVLQHCLEHVNEGDQKRCLVAEIVANSLILAADDFGNYVVQNVLDNIPQVVNDIVVQLAGNYFTLSLSRFGSNVVEKCVKMANEEQSTAIMLEIVNHPDILELIKDNYGNFVVQSVWNEAEKRPMIREILYHLIQANYFFLRNHMYGRRVVSTVLGSRKGNCKRGHVTY